MKHGYFVDIEPLFGESAGRNVEFLGSWYRRPEALAKTMVMMGERHHLEEVVSGKRVLLKPNWVVHSRAEVDDLCVRTSHGFLLAVLRSLLAWQPASVLIGDAPIQGCHWESVVTPSFLEEVTRLGRRYGVPVEVKDFRRKTFDPTLNNPVPNRHPLSEYTLFDVGERSFLEPVTGGKNSRFRVNDYDPRSLDRLHAPGRHGYVITNALFDSDVVISLPKVKTHQKVGMTAAVKNLVGLVGDKESLPHHRLGGADQGGDSYPGRDGRLYLAELASDFANKWQGKSLYWMGYHLSNFFLRLTDGKTRNDRGAWRGNDTTWRMVLDLNLIALYGCKEGTLSAEPRRMIYSICDGIIGGQGDGPLNVLPLPLGVVSLTNHSAMNDQAMATLMGIDAHRLPLLEEAARLYGPATVDLTWQGRAVTMEDLQAHGLETLPPPGWKELYGPLRVPLHNHII